MNQLAAASSAYLRSAAGQPVHWREWSDDAFADARARDRPVLLDVGAVWCHWCHVMDHESYEDPGVAAFLNEHFVCVKVDRDERPDVDARYQRAVQMMTGQGGWPLTAVLDADGDVVFGGTYFPPADASGRPGFRTVLERLVHLWRERRGPLAEQGRAVRQAVMRRSAGAAVDVTAASLLAAERRVLAAYDPAYGGFGTAPKFPHPTALRFLLRRWMDSGSASLRHTVLDTLHAMSRGGIHDQLGGGFHRYSVDRQWIIPHFEKMAADNAELLRAYAEAAVAFDDEDCRDTARGIVRWVRETLALPGGGFGASQDADVAPEDDGSYFTWTRDELASALDRPALDLAIRLFGVGTAGAMPHDFDRNVLFRARTAEALAIDMGLDLDDVKARIAHVVRSLLRARQERPAPVVDRTPYTSWNAMLAGSLLQAAPVLGDEWARQHALETLTRLAGSAEAPGDALPHVPGGPSGLLEDQVFTADAALDAFEATGESHWLAWAEAVLERVWTDYRDEQVGGFFDLARTRSGPGLLGVRLKPIEDAPSPSANGIGALVLARLAAHTGLVKWAERQQNTVAAFGAEAPGLALHASAWLLAADWLTHPPTHLVVVGRPEEGGADAMHRIALAAPLPRKVVRRLTPGVPGTGLPAELAAMLEAGAGRAYVCSGTRCLAPAATPDEWAARLRQAGALSRG